MQGPLLAKATFEDSTYLEGQSNPQNVIILEIDLASDIVLLVDESGQLRRIYLYQVKLFPDIKVTRLAGVPAGGILPHH